MRVIIVSGYPNQTSTTGDIDLSDLFEFDETPQQEFERRLAERQREHLAAIERNTRPWRPCMHDQCQDCHGTGIKLDGSFCVHMISCPCPKCSTTC